MNKIQTSLLLGGLLATLAFSGCSGMGVPGLVSAPTVSVQDVSLSNLSLSQGTAMVRLNLSNPNPFPLPLRGIEYGLRLNGAMVASGSQPQMSTINANQSVAVDIPVQLRLTEIFNLVPGMLRNGGAQYDLQGAVSLPLIKVPFSRQGGVGVSP